MKVLLVGLGDAEAVVARVLAARGHSAALQTSTEAEQRQRWLEERYDVVVDRWPAVGKRGSASWAASAYKGAFVLTVVDGKPDLGVVESLFRTGTDDVLARSAFESLLEERLLAAEHAASRRAAAKKSKEITVQDVTAHERQDQRYDLAENLSTILNSIGDGVITCDASGVITRMNPVAEELTGWDFAEAAGRPLDDVLKMVNPFSRETIESPVARALRHGSVVALGIHSTLVRPDGRELPIADSCNPIAGADGAVRGAVLVFRDVTAEHRARDREEESRRQLFIAERMASIGTLAAGAAHEINNPLSYVTSNLDVALEDIRAFRERPTSAQLNELEEMLQQARSGAERVGEIVRGLKTFSRSESGRRSVVDLKSVLELSANMAANEIRHRARLVEQFDEVPLVEVDGARLGQVFINLLVNAAQSLPDGQCERNEIRMRTSTDASGRAVIEIEDTGPGIPPAVLHRVFDPFFTTKAVGNGTGLGLSISQNTVKSMGGEITVESAEGKGTTFRVVLPAAAIQEVAGVVVRPRREDAEVVAEVLVVDDEMAVGAALRRTLRGHHVTILSSARDAVALLASGKTFDVILSDLMMPEMSGMDLHEEVLRRFPEVANRMVFITGGAFTPAAAAFLERVTNQRLEKPFDPRAVRSLVNAFSKRQAPFAESGTIELRPRARPRKQPAAS